MNLKNAGFLIRGVAFLIDFLLVNGLEFLLVYAISRALQLSPFAEQILDVPFGIGAYLYYYLGYQVKHQRTLGKRWLGLRVVDAESGQRFTRRQAALRLVGYLCSALIWGCGFLMAWFHPQKMGLHDLMSRTRVVRD